MLSLVEKTQDHRSHRGHAVCVPFEIQGHINPMMKLSLLLHHKDFHITFVHTEDNYNRLLQSRGTSPVEGLSDFQFATIPDSHPPANNGSAISTEDIKNMLFSKNQNCLVNLNELIGKLNCVDSGVPPVSCVIVDTAMVFALKAAEEIGVPGVLFQTAGACSDMCYLNVNQLLEKGIIPLKDEECLTNGYLNTPIDWIPGMIPLRLKDFPDFIHTTDPNDPLLNHLLKQIAQSPKATATILNTFDELEHNVLTAINENFNPVYPVGPLHLLFNKLIPESHGLKWMSSSLWKQEQECLKWLDSKAENSVIYVNFGSTTVMSPRQFDEFAWGLARSKKFFLLVMRPDLVQGGNYNLPHKFWEEVRDNGYVSGWCPQEQVLNHLAIGGFLTHCGWNSILESLCRGVPLLCWPFFTDQHINCKYACAEWGIGMEIDKDVKRDEVEFLVRELLDGEKGKTMKKKAMKWKKKAEGAVAPGGSSYLNFEKLINEVLNV